MWAMQKKCRWYRLLQELWEQSVKVWISWISHSRVDQGRCKRPHTLDSSWDWEVARPVSPLVTGCNPIQGNSSGWLAIQKLSDIKARILSKLSCENEFYLHAGMKQSVFFLKISKEIGKLWRESLTPRHALFQAFCLSARMHLSTQKYRLFCSLDSI